MKSELKELKTNEAEGNKLIAEFIGCWNHDPDTKKWGTNFPFLEDGWFDWKNVLFHTSWEWLMPVVKKINKLDDQIHLSIRGIELIRTIRKYVSMVQIEDAYMYIVEFIQWHNETQERGS